MPKTPQDKLAGDGKTHKSVAFRRIEMSPDTI